MMTFYLALIDEPTDKEKFTNIYNRYHDFMLKKALSILKNYSLAEEAVQESFFRIAKNISDFSSDIDNKKTAAFIIIIVRNVAIDIIKQEHIYDSEQLEQDVINISMDTLSELMNKEGYNDLISAVKELDSVYCDVLMLRFVYGYSCSNIAQLLKIPVRTVDSRLYRGKKLLKKKLEEKNEYKED